MSYRIQFDAFWEEFAKGSVGIQKEDFIKLFFIDISNIPEVYKKIQFTLTTINEEALRDTIIYKQYVENASETRVIFIANIIGKLYEYNDRNKSNIDVFFANNIIAVELGNLTLQINKKYKDLFLVQKQKSSSQYDLLVSQKQLLNQEYKKLFDNTSKVYTYVKIRHDGKINRRFNFNKLEKDNETLTVDYYNIDGYIEPAKELAGEAGEAELARELDSLQQNGPAQKHLFGPFNKIFTNNTETKEMAEEIFEQLRPKLDRQEEVFFIGYGTSGSGKTASLIFLQVGNTQTPGVLQHFANKLLETYKYDTLQITMFDFYVYFANTSTSASDFHSHFTQVKPIEIDGLSVIKFKQSVMKGGGMEWIQDTQGEPKQLGIFINEGFDKREVEPTSNNVDSSRSHVLVFLKFQKRDGTTQLVCVGDLAGVENVLDCPSIMKKMNQAYGLAGKHKGKNIPLDTYVPDQIKDRVLEKFLNLKTELKKDANDQPIPLKDKDGYPIKDQFEYGINGDILSSSFNVTKIGGAQYEVKTSIKELTDREKVSEKTKQYFPDGNPVLGDYSYEKCSAIKSVENLDLYIKYDESKSVEDNIKALESLLPADSSGNIKIEIFNRIKLALTSLKPSDNINKEYTTPKIFANAIQDYLTIINNPKLDSQTDSIAIKEVLKIFGFKPADYTKMATGKFSDPQPSPKSPAKPGSKTPPKPTGLIDITVLNMSPQIFDNFLWLDKKKGKMKDEITSMENKYQTEFDDLNIATAKKRLEIKCQILRIMKINYNCGLRRMEGYMINRSLGDMRMDIKNLVTISTNLAKYQQNLQYLRRAAEQIGILDGLSGDLLQKFITDNTSIILPLVIDNNVNPYCRNTNMGVIDPYKNFYKKLEIKKFDPIGILMRTIMQQGYNLENLNFVIFTVVHVSQKTFAGSIVNNPPPIPFIPILNLKSVILTNKIEKIKTELVKLIDVMKKFTFYKGFVINFLSNRSNTKTIENTEFGLLSVQESKQVAMELLSKIESNNSATTLGTLYATDILKNNIEHPFSCLVNDTQEREAFSKFNRDFPLVKTVEIDTQKIVAMQKYLKYKNKYLALKEKLRNRR